MKYLIIALLVTALGGAAFFIYKDYVYSYYDYQKTVNEKSHYPEGPLWKKGSLYYAEYSKHRIMKWNGTKNTVFWTQEKCGPASVIEAEKDSMLVACYDSNRVVLINAEGKTVKSYTHKDLQGPNDITSDSKGGFYITSSGKFDAKAPATGKIFHLNKKLVLKAKKLHYANGILYDKKTSLLLVNEHLSQRVTSFKVKKDGTLSDKKLFIDLKKIHKVDDDKLAGPDGIKMGPERRIYICYYGASRIIVANIYGDILNPVRVKDKYVTNCAFNKKDKKMYVTAVKDPYKEPYGGKVYQYQR